MNPSIRVPHHWTPAQVERILDLLEDLHQAICDQYGDESCLYRNTDHPAVQRQAHHGEQTTAPHPG